MKPTSSLMFWLLATVVPAQVLPNGDGQVEFIGLGEWTPERIRSAFGAKGEADGVHYCAANLIQDIGMADASCVYYPMAGGESYVVVTVVEEPDRVRLRPRPDGRPERIEAWAELAAAISKPTIGVQHSFLRAAHVRRDGLDAVTESMEIPAAERKTAMSVWRLLADCVDDDAFDRAVWALGNDPSADNRKVAALIVSQFGFRDLAWWSLADGLRDGDVLVRGACNQLLISLADAEPRYVDWLPVEHGLRCLLGGTNVGAFPHVLRMLRATELDAEVGERLLSGNTTLVRAYLAASHPPVRDVTRAFLDLAAGAAFEADAARFDWLDSVAER